MWSSSESDSDEEDSNGAAIVVRRHGSSTAAVARALVRVRFLQEERQSLQQRLQVRLAQTYIVAKTMRITLLTIHLPDLTSPSIDPWQMLFILSGGYKLRQAGRLSTDMKVSTQHPGFITLTVGSNGWLTCAGGGGGQAGARAEAARPAGAPGERRRREPGAPVADGHPGANKPLPYLRCLPERQRPWPSAVTWYETLPQIGTSLRETGAGACMCFVAGSQGVVTILHKEPVGAMLPRANREQNREQNRQPMLAAGLCGMNMGQMKCYSPAAQVVAMGSLGNVQSALAAEVEAMRARSAAQEDDYCDTIAELQAQVLRPGARKRKQFA